MVASYYLIKPLYSIAWHVVNLFRRQKLTVLYCDDAFDVTLFKNIQKHLPPIPIIAKNKTVVAELAKKGYTCVGTLPCFPSGVIMFRNMAWKFPCNSIIKVGLEHGAYNFKKFSKASYYNMFNVFLMTSSHDVERIVKIGVKNVKAIGYPKIDDVFDGSLSDNSLSALKASLHLDSNKKTILFSATWDGSGMSAVDKWYNRLGEIAQRYNVLVTVHPWVSNQYKDHLQSLDFCYFVNDDEILRYIMISDVCIGDTNSLIAEFCLLNKPIITFRVLPTPRTLPDIIAMIDRISIRINTFDEIFSVLEAIDAESEDQKKARSQAVDLFFDTPDGNAGRRAAEVIKEVMPFLS